MTSGISRSHRPGEIPHAFCAAVWCWPANVAARGRLWIQSRLTLLVLLGFIHGLLFWDGDILLAYGLVGLGVLLLSGLISDSQTSRAWTPDASAICMKNTGSFTAA